MLAAWGLWTCLSLIAASVLLADEAVLDLGSDKHLFLDYRYIESAQNVRVELNRPELPRENLLPKDKPWEHHLMGTYATVLEDGEGYRLYYESYAELPGAPYMCLAQSTDGVHWRKPNLGVVEFQGSKDNNIVAIAMLGGLFLDPFDTAVRRYKMITRGGELDERWPTSKGTDVNHVYVFYSPDGIHWQRDPEPVLPFYVGAPTSVFWDDEINRWCIYPRGYSRPGGVRLYTRLTVGRDELSRPYPFQLDPSRAQEPAGRLKGLRGEIPAVLQTDERDPVGAQFYTFNASKYGPSAYIAFPSVWYSRQKWYQDRIDPDASDTLETQFAFSRDGVRWQRPWREAIIPTGLPGSGAECQIYSSGTIRHDDQIFVYYSTYPIRHLTGDLSKPLQTITARAIWRLDGFTSVDAPYSGGEFTTPLVSFRGSRLEMNAQTGGGGFIRVEILDRTGKPVPGFELVESQRSIGNSLHHVASWKGGTDVSAIAGRPVRLRFVMRDAKLYAIQFVP